ncbi:hypothetical protein EV368DRAFT_67254 [Lentinula lateritia]|nr:hypothetical protein EV368DRAFT_67254 [Lentinula lateritia]
MSPSTHYFQNLTIWLGELQDDPAFTDFPPKLKNHILKYEGQEFLDKEQQTITIQNNQIYQHKHPYWFVWIIGVFHINIVHSGLLSKSHKPQKFNVLYVRWFGRVLEQEHYGIHVNHMPKLGFIDAVNPEAFGFVNPSEVLCGCHIIPAFEHEKTDQFLISPSLARQENEDNEDFFRFYVNIYQNTGAEDGEDEGEDEIYEGFAEY